MTTESKDRADAANDFIDVRQLLSAYSVDELNEFAEDYFARVENWDYHLSKPFGSIDEAPQLLINFATVLQGLNLCPGMTVLEFGAGTCWASRFLTQLGCRVIAVDVSPTALRMGQELYRRQPVIGNKFEPRFMPFDGYKLDMPDTSVDRVMCLDAFHHVPNPEHVLGEIARVLKNGGIAGFAEPGPEHSKLPLSQYEMRTYNVVENDIVIRKIWEDARRFGFTDIRLSVLNIPPFQLNLAEFEDFLNGGAAAGRYADAVNKFIQGQRNFFLFKGEAASSDSRYRSGLVARIEIEPKRVEAPVGSPIRISAKVTNTSSSTWLPHSVGLGGVHLGCHVYNADGTVYRNSYHWEPLTPGEGRPILPGETVEVVANVPPLPGGSYTLEFDMVSNDVCWFAINGSPQPRISLSVS
jgi:ubiquinone/menaquinone biosynthesis C-methylase UbiE